MCTGDDFRGMARHDEERGEIVDIAEEYVSLNACAELRSTKYIVACERRRSDTGACIACLYVSEHVLILSLSLCVCVCMRMCVCMYV